MKYHVILAAALCSVAGGVSAASFCKGITSDEEPQACTINADTDAEGMLVIARLTNVRDGAMPELLAYLQTLRNFDGTRAPARSRASVNTTLAGLMEVRPVQFFDNLVVLVISTAALRSRDENLSASLSDYEGRLNRILAGLTRNTLPLDREFRVNIKKTTKARLEISQRLNLNSAGPHDDLFQRQWSLHEEGINAEATWARLAMIPDSELQQPVTVAVIDQYIDPNHDELKDTGMEDGCDLTIQTQQSLECPPVQSDLRGHGTSVAGVIAAATDNDDGVAGTTWRGLGQGNIAKILPVQMDIENLCTNTLVSALRFSVDPEHKTKNVMGLWNLDDNGPSGGDHRPKKGAKVINMSFSFDSCSENVGMLMDRIARNFPDVLLVNAVANVRTDLDDDENGVRDYPASYKKPDDAAFDNLLTVTYSDRNRSIRSLYGNTSVDIAAPGSNDLPFLTANDGSLRGSSFAAPLVSSVAAVLKSLVPSDWGFARIKEYIMKSRDKYPSDWGVDWSNGGLLNMDAATKPPVRFRRSAPGAITEGTTWTVGDNRKIYGVRIFDPKVGATSLCGKLNLETQYKDAADTWPTDWKPLKANINASTLTDTSGEGVTVKVKSWDLPSNTTRKARVRLRCKGTQLFTISAEFDVTKN